MDISNLKTAARKDALLRRAEAHKIVVADISPSILEICEPYDVIAAYMPMRSEIDPLLAMQALCDAGKRICVPVIMAKNTPLIFCEWEPYCELILGDFGALIPSEQKQITPDLILAPLVAYDDLGVRLGYGGGFYDRTVARLRVPYIGLAYSAQRSLEPLPSEPTDIKLDAIITELGYRKFT